MPCTISENVIPRYFISKSNYIQECQATWITGGGGAPCAHLIKLNFIQLALCSNKRHRRPGLPPAPVWLCCWLVLLWNEQQSAQQHHLCTKHSLSHISVQPLIKYNMYTITGAHNYTLIPTSSVRTRNNPPPHHHRFRIVICLSLGSAANRNLCNVFGTIKEQASHNNWKNSHQHFPISGPPPPDYHTWLPLLFPTGLCIVIK